jgi:hypothetical protein
MADQNETLMESVPLASFTIRGGLMGAAMYFFLSLALVGAVILPALGTRRFDWTALFATESLLVIRSILVIACIASAIGFFTGREGAKCRSVNSAYLRGGLLCGIATGTCLPVLYFTYFRAIRVETTGILIVCAVFFAILTASGALIAGLAAIMVRDRRETGRTRMIPQFTLQEIFISFTLATFIISAMSTIAAMKL